MQYQNNQEFADPTQNQYQTIQGTETARCDKNDEEMSFHEAQEQRNNEAKQQNNEIQQQNNEIQKEINNKHKQSAKLNPKDNQGQNQNSQNKKTGKKCCLIVFCIVLLVIAASGGLYYFIVLSKTQPETPIIAPLLITKGFTVAIMGTNDLNGKVYPTQLLRPDTKEPYNYGGLATLITLKNIVSQKYQNNFLYFDAGDQLVGGIQSSAMISSGEIMNDFFKTANLSASTVGESDFGLGPQFQLNYLKGRQGRQIPNLVSNLIPVSGGQEWIPNKKSSMIFTLSHDIKIGVIGIITTAAKIDKLVRIIQNKTAPYQILDYTDIVLNESKALRAKGVNAIVLVAHAGNDCQNDFIYGNWTNISAQGFPDRCNSGQIYNLIGKLPDGTIDAVVQGHRNTIAHHYYGEIPFMGTTKGGFYTNFLYLNFDKNKKLINTTIEGPVPICQKVFQNTGRCDYVDATDISKAGKLIPWKFHGVDVTPNQQFNQIIKSKWDQKMAPHRDQLIFNTEIQLSPVIGKEYQLGNLITNLLRQIVPSADFVILDTEIFRSQWFPGPISYEKFFNMFPFTNNIISFIMTGDGLIQSLKSVSNSFFPVWNLQPIFKNVQRKGIQPLPYLFFNGTKISSNIKYKGVTVLLSYNSKDMFYNTNQIRITNVQKHGQFREKVKPVLKKLGTIKKGTLIDPLKPRAIVNYID